MDGIINFVREFETCTLSLLFTWAGASKFIQPGEFRMTLLATPWFWYRLAGPTSILLPIVEIVSGLLVLLGYDLARVMTVSLLLLFSAVAAMCVWKKLEIQCNCFGNTNSLLSYKTIIRNSVLICVAADSFGVRHVQSSSIFTVVCMCLLILALSNFWENSKQIASLRKQGAL